MTRKMYNTPEERREAKKRRQQKWLEKSDNYEKQLEYNWERQRKRRIEARRKPAPPAHERAVVVVYDPDPTAGFPAGAVLDATSAKYMCAYQTFTPGTVLRWCGKKLLRVVQAQGKQRLQEVR